jgi:hypothetical protein
LPPQTHFSFFGQFGYNTLMAANLPRRRWFHFGLGMNFRTIPEVGEPVNAANRLASATVADKSASDQRGVVHAIEDILLGVAVLAIASNDQIPRSLARDVVNLLLQAHQDGRAKELVSAAQQEVSDLPDWQCEGCSEFNPSTFEICWSCSHDRPLGSQQPNPQSALILEVESQADLRMARVPEGQSSDEPDRASFPDRLT